MSAGTEHLLARARQAKGFMPDAEGVALYRAGQQATAATPGPLLEIGTYCGKSALYLGAAALEGKTVLFSVDHHHGSEENQAGWEHHDPSVVDPATGRMDTLPWARRALEGAGLEDTVILVVGPSVVVASHWTTPLALLFIDGGHGAEVAWADYRGWSPMVAPGGLLALHDVFPDPADGGRPPYELYCEALASGRFVDCPELASGSLRVLRRRREPASSA
jgi:predicted O-methyltransferase YrrM